MGSSVVPATSDGRGRRAPRKEVGSPALGDRAGDRRRDELSGRRPSGNDPHLIGDRSGAPDPVVEAAANWAMMSGPVLVIAIDGHGASGKSTYADGLVRRLGATLVHTDDFFRPSSCRAPAEQAPDDPLGRYYDWRRLRAEALAPLLARRQAVFRRYDWQLDEVCGPDVLVAPRPIVILEGVFSSAPQLEDLVDRAVLIETPVHERLRRLRNKVSSEDWDDDWLLAEQVFFTVIRPPPFFDLVLSGAGGAGARRDSEEPAVVYCPTPMGDTVSPPALPEGRGRNAAATDGRLPVQCSHS